MTCLLRIFDSIVTFRHISDAFLNLNAQIDSLSWKGASKTFPGRSPIKHPTFLLIEVEKVLIPRLEFKSGSFIALAALELSCCSPRVDEGAKYFSSGGDSAGNSSTSLGCHRL